MGITVGKRLLIGFGSLTAVVLGLGGFAVYQVNQIKGLSDRITQDCLPGGQLSAAIESELRECYATLVQASLLEDEQEIKLLAESRTQVLAAVTREVDAYEKTINIPEDRANFDRFKSALQVYVPIGDKLLALATADKHADARLVYNKELKTAAENVKREAAILTKWNADTSKSVGDEISDTVTHANIALWLGTAIGAAVSVTLALLIARSLRKDLNSISQVLSNNSAQVASASGQVSASSQSLAQGASEQAASLEESSSALEEMASMIKKNADTSVQAATYSDEAKNSADRGTEAMEKMNVAIVDIERSAQETAKIIKVIDEIAFQTNLLALNAAVEAARAGEAGKGFAVVAEEVRNLAMRSAEAAKNTSSLIEVSVGKAKSGVTIASTVAENLAQINAATTKVTGLIAEIAAASKEQATGIDQISQAVGQMDKVTQTNAANAEETAAASEELNAQADQLRQCVQTLQELVGFTGTESSSPSPTGRYSDSGRFTSGQSTGTSKAGPRLASKPAAKDLIPLESAQSPGNFSDFSKAA